MRRPSILPGYYLSSEMVPKSHTTVIVPIREARTCLLIRQLLIRELVVPPMGFKFSYTNFKGYDWPEFQISLLCRPPNSISRLPEQC
ncbi:hypothetical protein AVEN_264619-1 [Araneus ventricosus]|uniref:Uncharacterized protein n=1 Tax=Araneus ventricosus TaxID=182803 RepID=A0A4Y2WR85_ARAVE|nr:hypothetical protein AVEN_264619-1 [Araneus ventricosus]